MKFDGQDMMRIKRARVNHDVHVGLLMMNGGLSKPDATVMAYLDGYSGLSGRMVPDVPQHSQPEVVATMSSIAKAAKPEATK